MKDFEKEIIDYITNSIRNVPDFPKQGIQFKDITTLLKDRDALHLTSYMLVRPFIGKKVDYVLGLESRGFMFGTAMAMELNAGFIPIRKPGKLPAATISAQYELEYGTDSLEIHQDAIEPGQNVVIHDDLIATGGTSKAASEMVKKLGGNIIGYSFIIELSFLNGRNSLDSSIPVHSLITL